MKSVGSTASAATKEGKKRQAPASDSSDDSDITLAVRKNSRSIEKEFMKEKEKERNLKRELAEIKAKNEAARARIVEARNDFPVFIVIEPAKYQIIHFLTCCGQSEQPPQHLVTVTAERVSTSPPKQFETLRTHDNMRIINSWMCPWLIAMYGKHFADIDNSDTAMEMLKEVVMKNEIGGFTAESFPEFLVGRRMEMLAFTKFVLRTVGNFIFLISLHIVKSVTNIMAGKATITHRKDMHNAMIVLCTRSRETEMRPQIVALVGLGIRQLTHVFISRASIRFIDEMCIEKGIVGNPVIFQTKEHKDAKMTSIVGTGATAHEKALRWIIGEFPFTFGPSFQHDLFLLLGHF